MRDVCFLFEHMFDSVQKNLTDGWRFYDPHVAPLEFLDWLSHWTAFTIDLEWPEAQKRALVIADNQLALNAGWDETALRVELEALREADYELDLIGFDDI